MLECVFPPEPLVSSLFRCEALAWHAWSLWKHTQTLERCVGSFPPLDGRCGPDDPGPSRPHPPCSRGSSDTRRGDLHRAAALHSRSARSATADALRIAALGLFNLNASHGTVILVLPCVFLCRTVTGSVPFCPGSGPFSPDVPVM